MTFEVESPWTSPQIKKKSIKNNGKYKNVDILRVKRSRKSKLNFNLTLRII